ncbi:MAG: hypothetical protein C0599_02570 [Salinivirgaceae bacterium]|nr:MAG: hypothetical protein C0599_02570 [Salinivirgaceae bacterium]
MNQPGFLDRKKQVDPALDFNFLRKEGISIIQELTGSFWTDFNLHDPGVTILEQLCYALTELSFRTDYDIEQLLFKEGKSDLPFYMPEDILTNNPLTTSDLRKVFLDEIPEIKNIWFEPIRHHDAGFNGLYYVLVDTSLIFATDEEEQALKQKIQTVYGHYRNVCEDIFEIKILEQLPITICGEIETDGLVELAQIMANIYFVVEQNINPEVQFLSLPELLEKGNKYHEIFEGPSLKHGFIASEELIAQPESIVVSDVVKLIMQVDGVVSVKNLHLELNGEQSFNQLNIPKGKIPKFIHSDIVSDAQNYSIKFYKGSLVYNGFKSDAFRKYLNELVSGHKKSYRVKSSTFEVPDIQQGLDFEEYYSIQNHFPAIYGVGPEGLPNKPTVERKAEANQLKGYLMIFEQFMANYLSQLSHFKELLSIHKRLNNTYFIQHLDNVPNANQFYANEETYIKDAYLELDDVPQKYKEGLQLLNRHFDDFIDRKNRMLDFLLAVHGESFTKYSLSQFNYYFTDNEFKRFQITCKSALLQHLANVNYNRASGINYFSDENVSTGLESRLRIVLGLGLEESNDGRINVRQAISVFDSLKKYKLKLLAKDSRSSAMKKWKAESNVDLIQLQKEQIDRQFDYIDDEDLEKIEESKESLLQLTLPFRTGYIEADFLVSGINLMNYKAGPIADNKNELALIHHNSEREPWKLIGVFKSEEDLLEALKLLIKMLVEINMETEQVYLVEHVLLRPDAHELKYGIYIKDEDGKYILKSRKQYALNQREEMLNLLSKGFSTYDNFSVEADENRDMNIIFKVPDSDLEFIGIQSNISVEETHTQMENLYRFLADKDKETSYEQKTGFYIQYDENGRDIPDTYYTYRVSLLFPDWTARFSNKEFRSIVRDVVWEQKPAMVYPDLHWLSPNEMRTFEKLRNKWVSHNKGRFNLESTKEESIEDGCAGLANFLYENTDGEYYSE